MDLIVLLFAVNFLESESKEVDLLLGRYLFTLNVSLQFLYHDSQQHHVVTGVYKLFLPKCTPLIFFCMQSMPCCFSVHCSIVTYTATINVWTHSRAERQPRKFILLLILCATFSCMLSSEHSEVGEDCAVHERVLSLKVYVIVFVEIVKVTDLRIVELFEVL